MFRKNKGPQKKEFNFTLNQITEDIGSIAHYPEQRDKLYNCIDDKVPVSDPKFAELNKFLTGNNNLEEVSDNLKELCYQLEVLSKDLLDDNKKIIKIATEALAGGKL